MADEDAPWGMNPNTGQPYKRDPALYNHLRKGGTHEPVPPRKDGKPAAKRATLKPPPKGTAADYEKKIRTVVEYAGEGLAERAPMPGAILQARAAKLAEPWGEIAVAKPGLGRFIDRMSTGGVWSKAIQETGLTVLLVAHSATDDKGNHTITGNLPGFLRAYLDRALREIMTAYLDSDAGRELIARAEREAETATLAGMAEEDERYDSEGAGGVVDGTAAL